MKNLSGDMTLMTLPDLMQWVEMNRKTGTLTLARENIKKHFYFRDGKIIFVSSNKEGERFSGFLANAGHTDIAKIEQALKESIRLGVPFTGYLIAEKFFGREAIEDALGRLSETVITDALEWKTGDFEFSDVIPAFTIGSPVMLHTSPVVFQSMKVYDEKYRKSRAPGLADFFRSIISQIKDGSIDIPPAPDIMLKLNVAMKSENVSTKEIVKLIMSDQILTSKILRVVNSPFYSPRQEITSLQQAIIIMGLKSILSIVTVHSMTSLSPKHADEIKTVLQHSLLCGFIAKKIAAMMHVDPEEVFVCGLLHDIGKTLLISLLHGRSLPDDIKEKLLKDFHAEAGYLLAVRWNLSEVIRYSIRYHHNPSSATSFREAIETVYYADIIAKSEDIRSINIITDRVGRQEVDKIQHLFEEISALKALVAEII
jgi:putative nucleotidyltransferase with HDIG domain